MSIQRNELNEYLNRLLSTDKVKDYCPNGLQVEGKQNITKIVTGVTASQALIDSAIEHQADAILVHHGFFWKGESPNVTGMKKARLKALLENDINLLAYHLPIDIHPTLGNNAQLANLLKIQNVKALAGVEPEGIVMVGEFSEPIQSSQFANAIEQVLHRKPLTSLVKNGVSKTVAWCTGGGQGYIDNAAAAGIDVFLTGEASEQTIHSSREQCIDFIAAGHHATERYGVKAVGEHLAETFSLDVQFIDIDNPV